MNTDLDIANELEVEEWVEEEQQPSSTMVIKGYPEGRSHIGMLIKRTYQILGDGTCQPVADDEHDFVSEIDLVYDPNVPAPFHSPYCQVDETQGFKKATDLIVQGVAHTYQGPLRQTMVGVYTDHFQREIVVHGDRKVEWFQGRPVFTEAAPFEYMPIRYDRAYGGLDHFALEREGVPLFAELHAKKPDLQLDRATPFHYERNPAGTGFLIAWVPDRVHEVRVPNLEYAFDPVTPERMAIGSPDHWMTAPLPAGMDYCGVESFPRSAYLGFHGVPSDYSGRIPEIELMWAPRDLLSIDSILKNPNQPVRPEFYQTSSPGMALNDVRPGQWFQLRNMHPDRPMMNVQLPMESLNASWELKSGQLTPLEPHINTIVMRPTLDWMTVTWCAKCPVTEYISDDDLLDAPRHIRWN